MANFDDLEKLEKCEKKMKDMTEVNPSLYTDVQRERHAATLNAIRKICGVKDVYKLKKKKEKK